MVNNNTLSFGSWTTLESNVHVNECHSLVFYSNDFHESASLLRGFDRYDERSQAIVNSDKSLRLFLKYSISALKDENLMYMVALEHICYDDDDKIRLIFYIAQNHSIEIKKEEVGIAKRRVYDKLATNLFHREKYLRKMLVLDERVL